MEPGVEAEKDQGGGCGGRRFSNGSVSAVLTNAHVQRKTPVQSSYAATLIGVQMLSASSQDWMAAPTAFPSLPYEGHTAGGDKVAMTTPWHPQGRSAKMIKTSVPLKMVFNFDNPVSQI